jgi:3-deoxy-7-phosphoheptulonate synthase
MAVLNPFKIASRETKHEDTIIDLGDGVTVGGKELAIMAGPCAVENEAQMEAAARAVKASGVKIMRGGAFKPRTNPYSFEGLGKDGLVLLKETATRHGLKTITEVLDVRDIETIHEYTDIFQIGTRNMQNFNLLKEVGKTKKPVLLKRGMSATVKEFLLAAEYILKNGNPNVILCERGIRTFETETRNTLAVMTVPLVKELSHLPIVVDPSHSTGKPSLVSPATKAAIAAGADGILIDVHPNPCEALCDGDQAITPETFDQMMKELKPIAEAVGRTLNIGQKQPA